MKRKSFYSIIRKGKVVGIAEQSGFEIKIGGEILNAYRSESKDRAHIIDPQIGLAIYIYDYPYNESKMPSEIEIIKRAKNKLIEDKELFEKWRALRSRDSYKLTVEMFAAYKHAEELREKRKEAMLNELNEARATGKHKTISEGVERGENEYQRTGRVLVLLPETERPSGRDGKRGQRHDPGTGRGRVHSIIRTGRGRINGIWKKSD